MHSSQILSFLKYQITRPYLNGHGIHSPFLFDFANKVLYSKKNIIKDHQKVKVLRNELLHNKCYLDVTDFGAGSTHLKTKQRRISDITKYSSSSSKYSGLLHKIVNYLQPSTIIELGTCIGIGTLYMATGCPNAKIYTLEGSEALASLASSNFKKINIDNITQVIGDFDVTLNDTLKILNGCDFVYIDGNHTKEATLRYFNVIMSFANQQTIMVFDDIRWSKPMFEAWMLICENSKVTLSIDLFQMGIIFFNTSFKKQHFLLYY